MRSIAEIMDALPDDWPYHRLLPRTGAAPGAVRQGNKGRDMSETEEEATLILALTDLPTATRHHLTALVRKACKASRAEGFAQAREQAARVAQAYTPSGMGFDERAGAFSARGDIEAAIRAMQPEGT